MPEITELEFATIKLVVLPMADSALQLRVHDATLRSAAECAQIMATLATPLRALAGVTAVVPSFDSVTLWLERAVPFDLLLQRIQQCLSQCALEQQGLTQRNQHRFWLSRELEAEFEGDLGFCAAHSGLTPEIWLNRFCQTEFTVGCLGFRPGFGYLLGLPEVLACPRRSNPRTRVPAGAIAVGGPYAGIYPNAGPGGWHVLGRCVESLFDPKQSPPCRLAVGDAVQFYL